ncbi:hypothetical protein ABW21_db0200142 [Orbilia brochopaga]|nr:hypothetical protein ABW21_db0200142 [Drechslerella brochopaga]
MSYVMQEVQHTMDDPRLHFQGGQYVSPISPQHPMHGYTYPAYITTVTTAPLSDLSQSQQTLLGVQEINVIGPSDYDHMAIETYPYQSVAGSSAVAADQGSIDHPMQLVSNDAPWDWPAYPAPMQISVEQLQPIQPLALQQLQLQPMQPLQQLQQLQPLQPVPPMQQMQQIPSPHHGSEHHTPVLEYASQTPVPDYASQYHAQLAAQAMQQAQQLQQMHSPLHSGQHTPVHEYPMVEYQQHLYQPAPVFSQAYHGPMYDGSAEGGFHHSPVEQEYVHGTPSPGLLHPNDAQYGHQGRGH